METVHDFEDMLEFLGRYRVRFLIIGGLAFIYHAKPRYTKDMDLWIDPESTNVERANETLAAFGSPYLLGIDDRDEILQLGVAPNRIDLLRSAGGLDFVEAWERRVEGHYGRAQAPWIAIEDLFAIKSAIDHPRHQEDARVLRLVMEQKKRDA